MKAYAIERTETADAQLHHIILNIAERFGADVALRKLDEIEQELEMLSANPELGMLPRYPTLRRRGYRVLILKKNLAFYKVDHARRLVTIYAVFDQRQDYLSIIEEL